MDGSLKQHNSCFHFLFGKRWFVLIMWQVASIILCVINLFNTLLSERNGSTLPFFQLMITYFILFSACIFRYEKSDISWLKYFVTTLFNFGGDVSSIYAYNTTSLSSAMLLATTVIFWVAPLSHFVLKHRMSIWQLLALVIGFCGVVLVFVADGVGDSKWLGNLLAVISAVCYAIANVLQEALVYSASVTLYLCRFSIMALPISAILSGSVEWRLIREYTWSGDIIGFILAYVILLAFYYAFIPFIMQFSNAAEMNISLLTSNFYALALSIIFFGQKADWLYLGGFLCVPIAIVVFTLFPKKKPENEQSQAEENEKQLDDTQVTEEQNVNSDYDDEVNIDA